MVHMSERQRDIRGQREGRVRGVGREAICESPRRPKACVRGGGCQICAPFPHPLPDLYLHCAAAAHCPALSSPGISNFSPRSHSLTTASEPARPLTPPAGGALDLILILAPCVFPWHCLPSTRVPTSGPPNHGHRHRVRLLLPAPPTSWPSCFLLC